MGHFWRRREFIVRFEAGSDVLAWTVRNGGFVVVFSEFEQSTRNVIRNFQRNDSQAVLGTKRHLIVVPTPKLAVAVRKQLRRYLSEQQSRKVAVVLLERLVKHLNPPAFHE